MTSAHPSPAKLLLLPLLVAACPEGDAPAGLDSAGEGATSAATDATSDGTTAPSSTMTSADATTAPDLSTESDGTTTSPGPTCGDGHLDPGELCDLGPLNANDGPCTLACAFAKCGDGFVQPGEACDHGLMNANDGPCTLACAAAVCGDGLIHAGVEECDDGDANSAETYFGCHPVTCTRVSWCGDGEKQPEEECDPEDPNIPALVCTDECMLVRKIIFVTSITTSGKLGGLAGADATCQALAGAAGLAGAPTFRAWLSDGKSPVTDRVTPSLGAYVRPDGVQIADHWHDLTDGTLDAPIAVDETQQSHLGDDLSYVWTNVATDSGFASHTACEGWTKAEVGKSGRVGVLNSVGSTWTHHSERLCFLQARLYCVEG